MNINDVIRDTLLKEGFKGSLNDMTVQWLKSEGAVADDINDLWHLFWNIKLIGTGNYNDRMYAWLLSEGAKGKSLNGAEHDYWTTRLALP